MSVDFILLGWILFIITEVAAKLLVCICVLGCGCPILMSAVIFGTALREFTCVDPISDSSAYVMTTLIILGGVQYYRIVSRGFVIF